MNNDEIVFVANPFWRTRHVFCSN